MFDSLLLDAAGMPRRPYRKRVAVFEELLGELFRLECVESGLVL